jgi:hypothetical protein
VTESFQAPAPPPLPSVPTRKGTWLWVLTAVSAALLVSAGVLGYLWSAENTSSRSELDVKDAQIADLEDRVEELENANERSRHDINVRLQVLADNRTLIEDLRDCPAKHRRYLEADGDAAILAAAEEMIATCHLAVRIQG